MAPPQGELLGREFVTAIVLFHDAVGKLLGVSAVERKTLDVIDRLGPSSNRDLATHTGLTTGAITGLIDRLEARGLVSRTADPHDRRRILVSLTDDPRRKTVTTEVFGELRRDMTRLMAAYGPAELAAIADFQRRTADLLKLHTHRIVVEQENRDDQ